MIRGLVVSLLLRAFGGGPAFAASEILLEAETVIACVEEETDLSTCAPTPVCDPSWAFFHRQACAEAAAEAMEEAILEFRARLLTTLVALDAKEENGGYRSAEAAAHDAWVAYRDANCAPDRSTAFNMMSPEEARGYCRVAHGLQRLATIRADMDRFSFKLAASE